MDPIALSAGGRVAITFVHGDADPRLAQALSEAKTTKASPDHEYYLQTKGRLGTKRARLSVARRMLRRSYHLLANLGEAAIEPAR